MVQIQNLLVGTLIFLTFSAKAQMLQAVKSTIQSYLSDNKTVTNYIGGLNITDTTPNSENKAITVKGIYSVSVGFSIVEKPFVAIVRVIYEKLTVEKLCYYKYLTAIDQWKLRCTNGAVDITLLPEKKQLFLNQNNYANQKFIHRNADASHFFSKSSNVTSCQIDNSKSFV